MGVLAILGRRFRGETGGGVAQQGWLGVGERLPEGDGRVFARVLDEGLGEALPHGGDVGLREGIPSLAMASSIMEVE